MGFAGQVETSGGGVHPIASTLYGYSNTAANTADKVVKLDNYDELLEGTTVHVKFVNGNTATPITLTVGGTAQKPVYIHDTTSPGNTAATSWPANSMVSFTYDGTAWRMNDSGANDAIITRVETGISTEATNRANAVTAALQKIAPAYDSTATYALDALCIQSDTLYKCTIPITEAEEWTAGHWTAVIVDGAFTRRLQFTDVQAGKPSDASASIGDSTGITAATVDVSTFEAIISTTGTYVFSYTGTDWTYNGNIVTISNYGITLEGTAVSGDTVTITYTAGVSPFIANVTHPEYPFRAIVPLAGVTSSMIPQVIFALSEAITGAYCPISETYDGGIYLYATNAPTAPITIPVIIVWR